jgi:D-alanyl-D-alanine dipeptidase
MTTRSIRGTLTLLAAGGLGLSSGACHVRPRFGVEPTSAARQVIVVTTPTWNATAGTLRRFERRSETDAWVPVGNVVPVVVGRTGLALGIGFEEVDAGGPAKREGDGKAPAGVFPLDTAFGFAPSDSARAIRLPYVQLTPGSDCVDDTTSAHYNTVVDKQRIVRADWTSAEHMRDIAQYQLGVIVGYNAPRPQRGRGSCIFLHIWNGPSSSTAGCTAFDASELRRVVEWLDPRLRPMLVQFPAQVYEHLRERWRLPAI